MNDRLKYSIDALDDKYDDIKISRDGSNMQHAKNKRGLDDDRDHTQD